MKIVKRYRPVRIKNRMTPRSDGFMYRMLDTKWRDAMRSALAFPGSEDRFKYPGGCNWFYDRGECERQCAEWNAREANRTATSGIIRA